MIHRNQPLPLAEVATLHRLGPGLIIQLRLLHLVALGGLRVARSLRVGAAVAVAVGRVRVERLGCGALDRLLAPLLCLLESLRAFLLVRLRACTCLRG